MAYTNYTVQVAAVNDQGQEGCHSQPVSIFTPEAGMLSQVCTLCEREIFTIGEIRIFCPVMAIDIIV